jgi:hypothetical protein
VVSDFKASFICDVESVKRAWLWALFGKLAYMLVYIVTLFPSPAMAGGKPYHTPRHCCRPVLSLLPAAAAAAHPSSPLFFF